MTTVLSPYLFASLCISFGNILPVDNLPDGLEVIRASILVLQIVSMLDGI